MEDLVVNGLDVKPINYIAEKVFFCHKEKVNDPFLELKKFSPERFLALDSTV